jgi:hypothetical protein
MIKFHNNNMISKIKLIPHQIHLIHKDNHIKLIKKNNFKVKIILTKLNKQKLKFKLF